MSKWVSISAVMLWSVYTSLWVVGCDDIPDAVLDAMEEMLLSSIGEDCLNDPECWGLEHYPPDQTETVNPAPSYQPPAGSPQPSQCESLFQEFNRVLGGGLGTCASETVRLQMHDAGCTNAPGTHQGARDGVARLCGTGGAEEASEPPPEDTGATDDETEPPDADEATIGDGSMQGKPGWNVGGSIDVDPNSGSVGTPVNVYITFTRGGEAVSTMEYWFASAGTGCEFIRDPGHDPVLLSYPNDWGLRTTLSGVSGIVRYVAVSFEGEEVAIGQVNVNGGCR